MLFSVVLSFCYLVYLSFLLIGIVGALSLVITLSGDSDNCSLCWDQGHNSSYSSGHLMLPGLFCNSGGFWVLLLWKSLVQTRT